MLSLNLLSINAGFAARLAGFFLTAAGLSPALVAQTTLPDFAVVGSRVANQATAGTFDMPVSALRYEPRVDVQARNLAEAQADIAIRGGVFESTGFQLGAAALGDPQTGHYAAEIPVPPAMLTAPAVLTGMRNALWSANAGAGTITYGWRPIRTQGRLDFAVGGKGYNRQSIYQGVVRELDGSRGSVAVDVELARSESDGVVPYGDHDFRRAAARLQWQRKETQTDVFIGYQTKFFGWPNLYTPFGFNETEDIQTLLALLNHSWSDAGGNTLSAAVFYRRNRDDYEFNRAVPGASNPFEHTTWMRGAALSGRRRLDNLAVNYAAHFTADEIRSTALTFGRYSARTTSKFSIAPEWVGEREHGRLGISAGVGFDHSNRNGDSWSPLASLEWKTRTGHAWYAEYSAATQLPTYTALNSNPAAGLFRGNPNLGRTTARNFEFGYRGNVRGWSLETAAFLRTESGLVDWTYRRGVVARTANAVDVDVAGLELIAAWRSARAEIVFSYSWLEKDSDYGASTVDASFYALNFPRHRATLAATLRLGGGFELRMDNEYRRQEEHFLRTAGGEEAWLSSAGLYFVPSADRNWEMSLLVENLWGAEFQEVPAVPSAGRQWAVGVARRW